jgi:mRNA-degrading endonuclease toxin of MazEF toxin-antitoxin module
VAKFARGQVWRADVPFNDEPAAGKYRPVVIIGHSRFGPNEDGVLLVVPVTSFGDGGDPKNGDVVIEDHSTAGLRSKSWARARRLWGLNPAALDRLKGSTGTVSADVMSQILLEAEKLFLPNGSRTSKD